MWYTLGSWLCALLIMRLTMRLANSYDPALKESVILRIDWTRKHKYSKQRENLPLGVYGFSISIMSNIMKLNLL